MTRTMREISAQIYRNVVTHHRNQIKFLCSMHRDGRGHRPTLLKLANSHVEEIKQTMKDWELSFPITRKGKQ